MGRVRVNRSVLAIVSALLTAQAVVACGSTSDRKRPSGSAGTAGMHDEPGEAGSSGDDEAGATGTSGTGAGGREGHAGFVGQAGGLSQTGGTGTAGAPTGGATNGGAAGGSSGCLDGAPCTCDDLTGTITCDDDEGPSCVCPPAEQCQAPESTSCFEPCGGEPFGSWVLEDSCYPRTQLGAGSVCQKTFEGTPGENTLRLRILDGGSLEYTGKQEWSIHATASVSCFLSGTVNACDKANFSAYPFLVTAGSALTCQADACGVCDCTGDLSASTSGSGQWRRDGKTITFNGSALPYCVSGDELWVGGARGDDPPTAAYKFKKQSCTGTPIPCADRDAAECGNGEGCVVGVCDVTTGTPARCAMALGEAACNSTQGCEWNPNGCSGTAPTSCTFLNCDAEPGCSWGEPRARCGDTTYMSCLDRELSQCDGEGCSTVACWGGYLDEGDCALLSATECTKAPGCTRTSAGSAVPCTGRAVCSAQTDTAICAKLTCNVGPFCIGEIDCSKFSVDRCHEAPGCRIEW